MLDPESLDPVLGATTGATPESLDPVLGATTGATTGATPESLDPEITGIATASSVVHDGDEKLILVPFVRIKDVTLLLIVLTTPSFPAQLTFIPGLIYPDLFPGQ